MAWISNVQVWGEAQRRNVEIPIGPDIDGAGLTLVPSFVDLACDPGFPGFPQRETPQSLGDAALAGGYSDLVTRPCVDPVPDQPEHLADLRRSLPGGVRVWPTPALTRGQAGQALTEFGLLSQFSIPGVSDGGVVVADSLILRNAMEYAQRFALTLWLRPGDPSLDGLGVVHDSPFATVLGLRGNPATNEEIGLSRILSLVRASGGVGRRRTARNPRGGGSAAPRTRRGVAGHRIRRGPQLVAGRAHRRGVAARSSGGRRRPCADAV